jgi:hypothetical protein
MMIQCPDCLGYRTRPEPYRWYEAPLLLFMLQPYRCRRCDHRFMRFRPPDLPVKPARWRTLVPR